MFSRNRLAYVALAGLLFSTSTSGFTQPAPIVQINAPRKAERGLFGGYHGYSPMRYGTRGAGITMAQQQRAAKKRRNVARHKAHARG